MVETAQQWYDRVQAQIEAEGYRPLEQGGWDIWPFELPMPPTRELQPPTSEMPRRGAGGVECGSCATSRDVPVERVIWHDELYFMTWVPGQSLPFAVVLMPRRHADLMDLTPEEAARGGQLHALIERAAVEALCVPRIQVARWGDGSEHLHWYLMGRPEALRQLLGSPLIIWDEVLPPAPDQQQRAAMDVFARRLVDLAGGTATPAP